MVFVKLNDQSRFNENEYLSPEQIKSFFSKLKVKRSKDSSQTQSVNYTNVTTSLGSTQSGAKIDVHKYSSKNAMGLDTNSINDQCDEEQIEDLDAPLTAVQLCDLSTKAMAILS